MYVLAEWHVRLMAHMDWSLPPLSDRRKRLDGDLLGEVSPEVLLRTNGHPHPSLILHCSTARGPDEHRYVFCGVFQIWLSTLPCSLMPTIIDKVWSATTLNTYLMRLAYKRRDPRVADELGVQYEVSKNADNIHTCRVSYGPYDAKMVPDTTPDWTGWTG